MASTTIDAPQGDNNRTVFDPRGFDMQAFGKEIRQSKETAVAFLIKAGILNKKGVLAKPYRD